MIVITGGSGFIGSNLVHALSQSSSGRLVIIDDFGHSEKWQNIKRIQFEDIIPPQHCMAFLDQHKDDIKSVIHLGAISTTTETDVDLILANNFTFSKQLLTWCTQHQKPLIYASSAATYGDGSYGFDDTEDLSYLQQLKPLNAYAWSKHLFDQLIARYRQENKPLPPQIVGLKFFNVYGPNEYHKSGQMSVMYQMYHQIVGNNTNCAAHLFKSYHPDYPDGGQLRDFVWVEDCINIIKFFMDHPAISGLFNVGSSIARSFNDAAHSVFAAVNKPANINYIDMPEPLRAKYQYYTQANIGKLRQVGYTQPLTTLEDGVAQYIQQYLTQLDCYR